MGIGTDKLGELYIQNLTTNKTTFKGKVNIKDMQYKINENEDKILCNLTFPRELNITLDNIEIDKERFQKYFEEAQTYSMTFNSITVEKAIYLRTIGFIIYPMKKSKSKRIQMKYDKKYGVRAVKSGVKTDDYNIDWDKKKLYF